MNAYKPETYKHVNLKSFYVTFVYYFMQRLLLLFALFSLKVVYNATSFKILSCRGARWRYLTLAKERKLSIVPIHGYTHTQKENEYK